MSNLKQVESIKECYVANGLSDKRKDNPFVPISTPGTFASNGEWQLKFVCNSCKQNVNFYHCYGSSTYIAGTRLIYHNLPDVDFLTSIGNLFNLELINRINTNNERVYYYFDASSSLSAASFVYFRCPHCNSQYMICYSESVADDVRKESGRIHLKGIFQVEFSEQEFLSLYNKILTIK